MRWRRWWHAVDGGVEAVAAGLSADVRREEQRRPGGFELGDEAVVRAARVGALSGVRPRKVGRTRLPDDVRISRGVDGHAESLVDAAAAQVRRIGEHGVDED